MLTRTARAVQTMRQPVKYHDHKPIENTAQVLELQHEQNSGLGFQAFVERTSTILKHKKNEKNYCASILASQSLSLLSFDVSAVTCWGGSGIVGNASDSVGGSGIDC